MKAVRIHKYGGPEKLVCEEIPEPSYTHQEALVRVLATGVNPVDWKIREGDLSTFLKKSFPTILGWDISGTVLKVGYEVKNIKPGDRVFGLLNIQKEGAYTEEAAVEADKLCVLPEGLDPVLAGALPMIALTGMQLAQAVKPAAGKRVLVTGAIGGVGRFAVYEALSSGAQVTAGVRGHQKEFARNLFGPKVDIVALDDAMSFSALNPFDSIADTLGTKNAGQIRELGEPGWHHCLGPGRPGPATRHPYPNPEGRRQVQRAPVASRGPGYPVRRGEAGGPAQDPPLPKRPARTRSRSRRPDR